MITGNARHNKRENMKFAHLLDNYLILDYLVNHFS